MERNKAIAAIATAPGQAAIGVVRISGACLDAFFEGILGRKIPPRVAFKTEFLAHNGTTIDSGLALFFPAPHSYTGESVLELQGHGSPVVLNTLLRRCLDLGARLAEPGEFTKRAYLNGKVDLVQAESVIDLIQAQSEAAARSAVRSLRGEFSSKVKEFISCLTDLRCLVEACLDFPEEEMTSLQHANLKTRLHQLGVHLGDIEGAARNGSLLREGVRVTLVGQPNVGKSSLLNCLAGEEVAIVTPISGTTRDLVKQDVMINGISLCIVDTAGIRHTNDPIESIGVARTHKAIKDSDLVLIVSDVTCFPDEGDIVASIPSNLPTIKVLNKIDLLHEATTTMPGLKVSTKTGEGLGALRSTILDTIGWKPYDETVVLARERHLFALRRAREHITKSELLDSTCGELLAEELRLAQGALREITGEFTSDDLLGEIFSRFCIGK